MEAFVIRISTSNNQGCWICNGHGDPARTLRIDSATLFPTKELAERRKNRMEKMYPNREYFVEPVLIGAVV